MKTFALLFTAALALAAPADAVGGVAIPPPEALLPFAAVGAITKAIPTLWAARIWEGFQRSNIWGRFATDISGEFAAGGDTLNLTEITSGVTVKGYSRNTDIDDPERLTDGRLTFAIDQQKYFNIAVDDVDRVQSKPNLMDKFSQQAGAAVAKYLDDFISGLWLAATPNAHKVTVADSALGLDIGATAAPIFDKLNALKVTLDKANWPTEGRACVLPAETAGAMRAYLIHQGVIGSGDANQAALMGELRNLFGMDFAVDNNLATPAASGDLVACILHRSGMYWASQIRKVEPYRLEKQFGDAVKGLFVYGAKVMDADRTYRINVT